MSALGQHIVMRLVDSRVIAPKVPIRRVVAETVLRLGRAYKLLTFRCADTHLHAEAATSRGQAGRFSQAVESSLVQRLSLEVSFAPATFTAIRDQYHLFNCFDYILDQERRHGLNQDPFHEGSALPDLLGLRVLGAYLIENLRSYLPRVSRRHLLGYLGEHTIDRPIECFEALAEAAAAAVGLPSLAGRSAKAAAAKRAAVHVAQPALSTRSIASLLQLSKRQIRGLKASKSSRPLVQAIDRQLRLRQPLRN